MNTSALTTGISGGLPVSMLADIALLLLITAAILAAVWMLGKRRRVAA